MKKVEKRKRPDPMKRIVLVMSCGDFLYMTYEEYLESKSDGLGQGYCCLVEDPIEE